MVMGRVVPIVLVTLCLLLYCDEVRGSRDGGRHIRRIKAGDLPVTSAASLSNSTTLPVATSKVVASVVAEDILQSGGSGSGTSPAPGSTTSSSPLTAPSYGTYFFGEKEDHNEDAAFDLGTVADDSRRTTTTRDAISNTARYSAILTTPRISLFDEQHSQVSEGIRQTLEELEERFYRNNSPKYELAPSGQSYSEHVSNPGSNGNGTLALDYSNKFSLLFNETFDPPRNVQRETMIENGTTMNVESAVLVHREYQGMELNSSLSTKSPTVMKKKKKIIIVPDNTTEISEGDSKSTETFPELPATTNLSYTTGPPGDRNSTIPQPEMLERSISPNTIISTTTKEALLTTSKITTAENATEVVSDIETRLNENSMNSSSTEVDDKSGANRIAPLRRHNKTEDTTERFIGLLLRTTQASPTPLANSTESARGGRMLVNENSTNSLEAEASQVPPSAAVPSADQGDKSGVRTKTTIRRINKTESESSTERFLSRLRSTTEITTTPSLLTSPITSTEWRSRSRSYPQRRPFAAAAVTTSSSEEEVTTRSSRWTTLRRRPPAAMVTTTISITSTTENNSIIGPRPAWRRRPATGNGTDNSEVNDLKPNRGRGSVRYGTEFDIPPTATAWTLVSLRSPPSNNTTRLVRQPGNEKLSSTRGRRPVASTTQSSMQENRVSVVQVLAPLLAAGELMNFSVGNDSNTTASPMDVTLSTMEPSNASTEQSSTLASMTSGITTTLSNVITTQMPSNAESITVRDLREISSNNTTEAEEITTLMYDITTLDGNENITTIAEATTANISILSNNSDSSSDPGNNASNIIEAATTNSVTFITEAEYFTTNFVENSTNSMAKMSNLENDFENTTQYFNKSIATTESTIAVSNSMKSNIDNITVYPEEITTTVESTTQYTENFTTNNSTDIYSPNTTDSFETVTLYPEVQNATSEPKTTLVQYSTNVTVTPSITTTAGYTVLAGKPTNFLTVTPADAEENDISSTTEQTPPPTTGMPSVEFGEDDASMTTQRENPEEESFDQSMTTTGVLHDAPGKHATPPFLGDTAKEITTEVVWSSSVSEIDWEERTTVQPPVWEPTVSIYLRMIIDSSWEDFCSRVPFFRVSATERFKECTESNILPTQVVLDDSRCNKEEEHLQQIEISMYLVNEKGDHDAPLTLSFGSCFGSEDNQLSGFVVERVEVMPLHEKESGVGGWGVIAAIAITCVGAVCLLIFLILMVILRKRQKKLNYGQRCTPVSLDAYSLDSVSICGSTRRKGGIRASKRSYGNAGFDDPGSPSHPMGFAGMANFVLNRAAIDEEFAKIPQVSASVDELPEGAETRNRYANVIPLPETRVTLSLVSGDPLSHYINANFVRGPKEERKFYIACQAPLPTTVTDFWRMIWEQQSRAILMLSDLVENGVEKCADYLPPSEVLDCHRLFGDFQVTLKKREVKEKYIISTLQLKNLETNSWREVTHLWYVGWPAQGVPPEEDTASVIAFLLEARPHMRNGPTVVHCSPGTGRTGTVIACDLCIRDFETTRIVDVPRTLARIRRDRAGAVQTRDQYAFIYQVINLYGMKLTGGALDSI